MHRFRKIGWWVLLAVCAACGQIDDDLSDCEPIVIPVPDPEPEPEPEPEAQLDVDYELKLVTNMTTELQTQLNTVAEVEMSEALKDHLGDVFKGYAHDVDLSFYDTENGFESLVHINHIMNDSTTSYSLYLPMREYMHLACANIVNNSAVSLDGFDNYNTARLLQATGDTINSHETGLFTARAEMRVIDGVAQTFDVKLYMANASAALVVDTTGVGIKSFRAYAKGFATSFQLADSLYVFDEKSPYIRANQISMSDSINQLAFCTVNFPSRNPNNWRMEEKKEEVAVTRAIGEIIPEGESTGEKLWEYVAYVTLADGSVTQTTLTISQPLLAGEFKIIRGRLDTQGVVQSEDAHVTISVSTEWSEGATFNTELKGGNQP